MADALEAQERAEADAEDAAAEAGAAEFASATPPTDEEAEAVDAHLRRCEVLKAEGNEAFREACRESDKSKSQSLAADAAIYYLDVLDCAFLAEQLPMTDAQRLEFRQLRLATLLNRAAARDPGPEQPFKMRCVPRRHVGDVRGSRSEVAATFGAPCRKLRRRSRSGAQDVRGIPD